ncbi:hypothetical protein KAR91_68935, partial [Candidatus Pacearchaeota archaeon]|nr:hypothetical protein [Candidatus Pacearchaeota archaeon]
PISIQAEHIEDYHQATTTKYPDATRIEMHSGKSHVVAESYAEIKEEIREALATRNGYCIL